MSGLRYFFFRHKKSAFQTQAAVFIFFFQFEAQMFLWLFLDYREKYALLLQLDRFNFILPVFITQKYVKKGTASGMFLKYS